MFSSDNSKKSLLFHAFVPQNSLNRLLLSICSVPGTFEERNIAIHKTGINTFLVELPLLWKRQTINKIRRVSAERGCRPREVCLFGLVVRQEKLQHFRLLVGMTE
jgi:hypothetical protein